MLGLSTLDLATVLPSTKYKDEQPQVRTWAGRPARLGRVGSRERSRDLQLPDDREQRWRCCGTLGSLPLAKHSQCLGGPAHVLEQ